MPFLNEIAPLSTRVRLLFGSDTVGDCKMEEC